MAVRLVLIGLLLLAAGTAAGNELKRKAMFGAFLGEDSQKKRGVVLTKVIPDSSAEVAGFRDGDILVNLGETAVSDIPSLLALLSARRAGDELSANYLRNGKEQQARVRLKEKTREKGDGYKVHYGSITNGSFRQRTILTVPPGDGPHPAVLFLQGGHTCFPVDAPFGNPSAFVRIAQHLARNGYVTMRIERPGCGDSEGGPLRDTDFETELAGNREAARALKQYDFVNADNVLIYGFSMGGMMAPLIAVDEPVRGIATYGTTSHTWFEGVTGQRRRLLLLKGKTPAEVNNEMPGHIRFWYQLTVELKTVREILNTKSIPDPVLDLWARQAPYVAGRHFKFYHQISQVNFPETWSKLAATPLPGSAEGQPQYPRVLTLMGAMDWHITKEESTDWIIQSVNQATPGVGTSVIIPDSDHFSNHVKTAKESYQTLYGEQPRPKSTFNPAILGELLRWCDAAVGRTGSNAG